MRNRRCEEPNCTKCPSFNYPGVKPGLYCGQHKRTGMVDVKHKRSRAAGDDGGLAMIGAPPGRKTLINNAAGVSSALCCACFCRCFPSCACVDAEACTILCDRHR